MTRKLGIICLALFLLLFGLLQISNIRFEMSGFLLGILAIASGILLILDR